MPSPGDDRLASLPVGTPALVIDVDTATTNHRRLAESASRLALRPHFKAHKTTALLRLQPVAPSAVCTQTAAEALVCARAGVEDVLITNQVVDGRGLDAAVEAARHASVSALADDAAHVELLGAAARRAGVEVGVAVEIDVGMRRCGLDPGSDALPALVELILATDGLRFIGLQAYEGHAAGIADPGRRQDAVAASGELIASALDRLDGATDVPWVGGGSTATTALTDRLGPWTETQAGSYLLMDGAYGAMADLPFDHALFLLVTVLHRSPGRLVVDAGLKSVAVDRGAPVPVGAGMSITRVSDEHAVIDLADGAVAPPIGTRLLLIPGHVDPTMNLHPSVALVRGALGDERPELLDVVPVDGRRV